MLKCLAAKYGFEEVSSINPYLDLGLSSSEIYFSECAKNAAFK
jgi:hypothetical protein